MQNIDYALSIKQPWATLLVRGHKTVEVRRWPTARRGRILIHAGRVSDPRKEAWDCLPDELLHEARLVGGIIGCANLVDCLSYRQREQFVVDEPRHLNRPTWFDRPVLYGFVFKEAKALPFAPLAGWMRFFPVAKSVFKSDRTTWMGK
jgi:hypothetical protein